MDCEIETEGDSEGKIKFYMTKYGDYELSTCNLAYTYWLQDMFDYNNEDTSEDEFDASELDDDSFLLDDLDI